MDEQIDDQQIEGEQQRVKHQKPVRAEQVHERRRHQRINVRLRDVEARVALGILALLPLDERERARAPNLDVLSAFEEDALRARVFLPDSDEILSFELEIEVAREAEAKHVIGRFVPFECTTVGLREIHRKGKRQQQNAQQRRGDHAGSGRHGVINRCTALGHVMPDTFSKPACPIRSAARVSSMTSRRATASVSGRGARDPAVHVITHKLRRAAAVGAGDHGLARCERFDGDEPVVLVIWRKAHRAASREVLQHLAIVNPPNQLDAR